LDFVFDLISFSFSNSNSKPNPTRSPKHETPSHIKYTHTFSVGLNPTHSPKHETPSPHYQFSQRI